MEEDYRQYLARSILTEDQVITYRALSRALNAHTNAAKEMLYDFHKSQNEKRPGTLYATYLVYGTRKKVVKAVKAEEQDGDVEMTDSHPETHLPFSDEVPTYTLSLISEAQLEEALAGYDEVTSIHVYSLGPHPVKDIQLLIEPARQVMDMSTAGTVPAASKVFGSIMSPDVHIRVRPGHSSKPVASTPKAELKSEVKQEAKQEDKPVAVKEEPKVAPQGNAKGLASSAPVKKSAATASLKRQGSSGGIGQMFAKAAAKPKKPAAKISNTVASSAAEEDQKMAMSDDGEDDTEPMPEVKEESSSARQSRINRQAELRRMMEESDEEEPEKPESPAEEPMEEDEPLPEPEPKAEEPAEVISSTGDGRRRGRRRVTRKKQVMDDNGYLVTIQEQGWESFSEDEAPPPSKPKSQPIKSEPAAKPKKATGKGQGNIMSFFSKK
ncbi:DNA polymerase subunit Cdc27 [Hypoxylon rubiginosum]|uniref:DNA polymerase subunit Cdc27 n=1 Tax=Hypoxylon rubiginosum TaxID=110542 RepID=A0ACC0CWQ9_9PEZI|nr:DNA polymerase subunit Cdc27 [Hypoxylon rubiginosum]